MKTTYKTFSCIIILAQCFGLLPLVGVSGPNILAMKFEWKSYRFFYGVITLLLVLINCVFFIVQVNDTGLSFNATVTLLFFGCSFITTCLFLHLSFKWPIIMREWYKVDEAMELNYGFPSQLHRNFYFVAIIVIGASLAEHAFFMTFSISNSPAFKNATNTIDGMNGFFRSSFNHVFAHVPYNFLMVFILEYVNIACTFSWNYMDLFIMVTAIALSARFQQINQRIRQLITMINTFQEKEINHELLNSKLIMIKENNALKSRDNSSLWMEIREDYNRLSQLTRRIDDTLAYIIVLSFANNLFVILVQLLHSIEPRNNTQVIDRLYFMYSFGFLILRASAVAIFTSKIYSESRRPVWYLTTELPNAYYNEEVERLLMEIRSTGGCYLSGNGFFKIRSSLILGIAGAIVSYELIFIQFN